jgi:hypothetical protein
MSTRNYWINTIAREHVMRGVAGGFTQANHGSPRNLKRLQKGDVIVFYSGKTAYPKGEPYQKFTALGIISDDEPYQVEMTPDFHPFRRTVRFVDMHEAPIKPLVGELSFIHNPAHWGFPFRRGLFEIPEQDFLKIAATGPS